MGNTLISIVLAATLSSLFTATLAKISYYGVNEAGGEFGGSALPGVNGTNYQWPNKATVDIFVDEAKVNTFRLPFLLERMCPPATGLGATFDEDYWNAFLDSLEYMTKTKGVFVITDPHNYMRYNDPSGQPSTGSIIGNTADSKAATTAQFGAFFKEFASRLADNGKVIFSLMNEPHDMSTQLIVQNEQAAITAIRTAGATQMILAAGNGYTGGHTWTQSVGGDPSSEWMHTLTDPADNLVFEIHEYLNSDYSGGGNDCSQPGPSNLEAVTAWAVSNNAKLMLTEFGGGANTQCYQAVDDLLTYLEGNPVYIGWTAWAAGAMWNGADACCGPNTGSLEPNTLTSSGQPGAYDTVWKNAIAKHIPAGGAASSSSAVATTSKAAVTTSKASSSTTKASTDTTTTIALVASSSSVVSSVVTTKTSTPTAILNSATSGSPRTTTTSSRFTTTKKATSSQSPTKTATSASSSSSSVVGCPAPSNSACAQHWFQCGGNGWTGPTCCADGTMCTVQNDWYSQCL